MLEEPVHHDFDFSGCASPTVASEINGQAAAAWFSERSML
jgi:hypothetical protein